MKAEQRKTICRLSKRLCAAVLVFCILVPLPVCCNCTECPKNALAETDTLPGCPCSHSEKNAENSLQHNHSHQTGSVPCECACVKPAVPLMQNNTQTFDLYTLAVITPACFALSSFSAGTCSYPNNDEFYKNCPYSMGRALPLLI